MDEYIAKKTLKEKFYLPDKQHLYEMSLKRVSDEEVAAATCDLVNDIVIVIQETIDAEPAANVVEIPPNGIGSLSDGYHTFDELYRHRGILFAMICADHPDIAWKSLKHHDGTMFPGMFICCIDTPYGQASYHMDLDPFWNLIQVRELDAAPEWDGHTTDMALNRIAAMAADRFVPIEGGVLED